MMRPLFLKSFSLTLWCQYWRLLRRHRYQWWHSMNSAPILKLGVIACEFSGLTYQHLDVLAAWFWTFLLPSGHLCSMLYLPCQVIFFNIILSSLLCCDQLVKTEFCVQNICNICWCIRILMLQGTMFSSIPYTSWIFFFLVLYQMVWIQKSSLYPLVITQRQKFYYKKMELSHVFFLNFSCTTRAATSWS